MMEGAVPEPMFFPPPYMPIKSPHNLRTPKWTGTTLYPLPLERLPTKTMSLNANKENYIALEEELAAKEQEMSEKIGAIERAYYSHRYHQLTVRYNSSPHLNHRLNTFLTNWNSKARRQQLQRRKE